MTRHDRSWLYTKHKKPFMYPNITLILPFASDGSQIPDLILQDIFKDSADSD